MTKNDYIYKILFAVELALVPLVIFASMFMPNWSVCIFLICMAVCKIWREILKDKTSFVQNLINSIAGGVGLGVILLYFTCVKAVPIALGVVSIIAVILYNLLRATRFGKHMPDTIDAVDFCYMLFEILLILTLSIIDFYSLASNVAIFAVIITAVVSIAYKVYFLIRYTDLLEKLKIKRK